MVIETLKEYDGRRSYKTGPLHTNLHSIVSKNNYVA